MAREQRRLAAIVAADVAGYSRLMGLDESGTLASLNALRRDVVEPAIARHAGRLFKTMGDGFLIEFASAVQAVSCAAAIQKANRSGPLPLRIGIHLGDVVVQGDDLMGDGVNIAARVEGVAEPRGIAISRQVHDQVRGKAGLEFEDRGEVALKNLTRPVHVFTCGAAGPTTARPAAAPPVIAPPAKPSLAVLPFHNMGGDPAQEYFADGIAEDIITNLSKFREFNVISRNSSFAHKGERLDIAEIGRLLKCEYIVEGSVRSAGNRVRITAQLASASSGSHLWAQRYDRDLSDVFAVQDEITARIATAVDPAIRDAETKAALRKHPANLGSWDHLLRGLWHLNQFKPQANAESRREFERAIERDPGSAPAHAWLALTHVYDAWFNWTQTHAKSLEEGHRQAALAVRLDAHEPVAHVATAFACFWSSRLEQARNAAELAVSLNPNSFLAYYCGAGATNYLGQCEAAVPLHLKALDLSPTDPLVWNCLGSLAHTYFNLGRFDDAVATANRAIVLRHGYLFGRVVKTAALAHSGQPGEAAASLRAIFDIAPDFSLARLAHYPFVLDQQRQHLFSGLAKAGLLQSR